MKKHTVISVLFILTFSASIFAQFGNADPEPINFAKGKTSKTTIGQLNKDQQQDFVFSAAKGQKVKLSITSTPSGKLNSFKVFYFDGEDNKTMVNKAYDFTFTIPETCDYYVTIIGPGKRFKKDVKFALKLKITD